MSSKAGLTPILNEIDEFYKTHEIHSKRLANEINHVRTNRIVDHVNKEIGKNIRFVRKKAKMSVKKLAPFIGVSGEQLCKYELGVNKISCVRLILLAEALNVDMDILLGKPIADFRKHNEMLI